MTVSEALLNCISAALDGRDCALTLAPDDWTALLRLAGEQKLLPLVYAAVRGTPGFAAAPEAVRAAARPADMREAAAPDRAHGGVFAALSGAARRGTCAGRRQGHRLPRSVSAAGAAPLKR